MSDFSQLPDRFWAKVQPDPSGCWIWTGALNSRGYGSWGTNGIARSTHRVTYEAFVGPVPTGLTIDHLCEVKACCNPVHLEVVTRAENSRRHYRRQTHCKYGHPLSGSNLKVRSNGQRRCIECRDRHSAAFRQREKATS
jgi:hypothetical protein